MPNAVDGRFYASLLNFSIDASSDPLDRDGSHLPVVASQADLDILHGANEAASSSLTSMGAQLGGEANLVQQQMAFDSSLTDALTSSIGSLVDADMNVSSTRLQALQTQQQPSLQALSMTNPALFRKRNNRQR